MILTPEAYSELNFSLIAAESNSKIASLLAKHGFDEKNYDWKRFMTWLEGVDIQVDRIIVPSRPSKYPLSNILAQYAGPGEHQNFIACMYHVKWLQTEKYIDTDLEKFVRLWGGSEYASKPGGWGLKQEPFEKVIESLCKNIIPYFNRWGLEKGPSIVNSFMKIMMNLSRVNTLVAPTPCPHELGSLFLQSGFIDQKNRIFFSEYTPSTYIRVARALGIPEDDVQKVDSAYLIKTTTKSIEGMNADQKSFIQIEEKFNSNPKNKTKYIIHDMSLSPEQAIMKAWKICLGTGTLRPDAFNTQINRLLPIVGTETELWVVAEKKEVIDGICTYIRDLGTPGLGLVLGSLVSWLRGESVELRRLYYHFLNILNGVYATESPNMVSPKATYYVMIIAATEPAAWQHYKSMMPRLQYISKLPDMIDSERIVFDLSSTHQEELFKQIIDEILLPEKQKLTWNDPRVLLMILKSQGYEKFMEFDFSDPKIQEAYELLAKTSPKSPYLRMLAAKNMKIRNEVFSTIQKRMALGGLDPIKFCDPSRNIADLPATDISENIKTLFAKSFDNLKISQWRQDVIGSKEIYGKAEWMVDIFVKKVEERAHLALGIKAHSVNSMVTITNALPSGSMDNLLDKFPHEELRDSLKVENTKDTAELVKIIDNLNKYHWKELTYSNMVKLLDSVDQAISSKKDMNEDEKQHQNAIQLGICDIIGKWHEIRKDEAERLFAHAKEEPSMKAFVSDYFTNFSAINNLVTLLNTSVIRPHKTVTAEQMRILLKYNKVELPTEVKATQQSIEKIETLAQMLDARNQAKLLWRDLEVKKVDNTRDDLQKKSVELDLHNRYKHGDIAAKVLEEYNVAIPVQIKACAEFDKDHPNDEIIEPAFHGTGSIAASFILRFGYAIINTSGGGVTTVGKSLGDGIYFSTVLDKCAQYIGDGGFSRGIGQIGYIFEMRANLGVAGEDYRSAGLEGATDTHSYVSPEWCAFKPNSQLRILKAYKVELITKNDMRDLKGGFKSKQKNDAKDSDLV